MLSDLPAKPGEGVFLTKPAVTDFKNGASVHFGEGIRKGYPLSSSTYYI